MTAINKYHMPVISKRRTNHWPVKAIVINADNRQVAEVRFTALAAKSWVAGRYAFLAARKAFPGRTIDIELGEPFQGNRGPYCLVGAAYHNIRKEMKRRART